MLVGLTGSIGSGKSLAASILGELGAVVVDADELARDAVKPGSPALGLLVERFGADLIDENGRLKRSELADIVFSDPAARRDLEMIIHPEVLKIFRERLPELRRHADLSNVPVVFVVPLLYEAGWENEFEAVIVITVPRETALERVMKRDKCSREQAERRYSAQMPMEEKIKRADFVVANDAGAGELRQRLQAVFKALQLR